MDSRWRNMLNMVSFYRTNRQLALYSTRMSVRDGAGSPLLFVLDIESMTIFASKMISAWVFFPKQNCQ
jgi:hypothetical protein